MPLGCIFTTSLPAFTAGSSSAGAAGNEAKSVTVAHRFIGVSFECGSFSPESVHRATILSW